MHAKVLKISIAAVLLIAALSLTLLPPSTGKLPRQKSQYGISEKVSIPTDKGELGLMLLSEDINKPVLLVCGGGPAIPQYLLEYLYPSVLPSEFTVCYWDYRGICSSYDSVLPPEEMDTERFIKDTLIVTDYLRDRFKRQKIYIMGHSFGSHVALNTVSRYPDRYICYIAMSQAVDKKRSEKEAFDYMRQRYTELGNRSMAEKFDRYDITKDEDFHDYVSSGLRDEAMHGLGVGTARDMDNVITGIFFPSLRCTAYTQMERINIWRGKSRSNDFAVHKDTKNFNAIEDIPEIKIPIVFIAGRYDKTCCTDLQEEYYNKIKAPYKRIYIFEKSAHSPIYEEADTAQTVLKDIKEETSCI